jgi:4-aminobutyrate aminotransferase
MSDNASLWKRKEAVTPRGVGVMTQLFAARAENSELWDVEGKRYVDFAGGIAVLNVGHRHPKVVEAVKAQLDRFTHSCYQIVPYESYVALAERLVAKAPIPGPRKATFFSTGAEALENAVKIARAATGRPGVITFSGAFHGRTMMALALTGKVVPYKTGFGPFPGDVYHLPFPIPLHGVPVEETLHALHTLFKADIDPKRVAAIVIEPVQGEGGFYVAPPELMKSLRTLCDAHGILLVADEVQTGFGRTGRWFAMEHHEVSPDLVTVAKSLAAGLPLSAVVGRADVMDAPAPGGLGGTYAGNPLAVAAAHAVFDVMESEKLVDRANALGDRVRACLGPLAGKVPRLAEVRGLGAMLAAEFMRPGTKEPDADFTKAVQKRALDRGLLLLTCGVHANVIRFLFPLTIPEKVLDEGLGIFEAAVKE